MRTSDPARRELILDKAGHLFASRHYHEVRIEDIAQEVGVAKGTIYCYFEDKEDLYLALILSGLEQQYAEVRAQISEESDPEEKLHVYVRSTIEFFKRCPYFLELAQRIEALGNAKRLAPLIDGRHRFFELVAELIAGLASSRQYRMDDPALASLALTGMIRQILRFHPQPWPDDLPRWIVKQFLHGLEGERRA